MKAIAGRLEESHGATLQGVVDYAGLRLREKPQPKGGVKLVRLVGYVTSGPASHSSSRLSGRGRIVLLQNIPQRKITLN